MSEMKTAGTQPNQADYDHSGNSNNKISSRSLATISEDVRQVLTELIQTAGIQSGQLLVIGTSTSEVIGEKIGTAGASEVAERIFQGVEAARSEVQFYPVFQCCEHLNRALVLEREALSLYPGLEEVSVVPVPRAGGSMAAWAYSHWSNPVVVETMQAHAGLDIGETMIGMHLRRVAVPLRPSIRWIGQARVAMAYSRPKLIGGARAQYNQTMIEQDHCE